MKNKKILWLMNQYDSNGGYSPAIIWWYGILENLGYEVYYEDYAKYDFDDLYRKIKDNKIDFFIHPCYDKIHPEFQEFSEFCKVYVLQSDDLWRYDNYSKYWISVIDGVITFEGNIEKYKNDGLLERGFNKIRWSFNPNTMTTENNCKNKDIFCSHVGGLHANRPQLLNELMIKGLQVNVYQRNLNYEQVKDVLSRSKFSLNFTMNSTMQMRELKGRVAEVPYFK